MAKIRCATHDVVFDTQTNHSFPGEGGNPAHCHADCPKGKHERGGVKKISRADIQKAATSNGISFDTAAQQAVAQGFEVGE
jgi:hypothetical protein